VKCYIWSRASYGVETWTLQKVNQKYTESFKMWRWKRMEKISLTDHVRNEEVLQRVKGERNVLPAIKRRKANVIGHILLRNYLLKLVFEGKIDGMIEVTGRRERRCKQPLDDVKEERRYRNFKEEVLDRILWGTRFGRYYGPAYDRQENE